jgi:hypothetical protein
MPQAGPTARKKRRPAYMCRRHTHGARSLVCYQATKPITVFIANVHKPACWRKPLHITGLPASCAVLSWAVLAILCCAVLCCAAALSVGATPCTSCRGVAPINAPPKAAVSVVRRQSIACAPAKQGLRPLEPMDVRIALSGPRSKHTCASTATWVRASPVPLHSHTSIMLFNDVQGQAWEADVMHIATHVMTRTTAHSLLPLELPRACVPTGPHMRAKLRAKSGTCNVPPRPVTLPPASGHAMHN